MGYTGASADSDGGLLTGMGVGIGEKVSSDFANRITPDTNTSPNRIRYLGDPTSAFEFSATTVMPSFKQGWNNSAHSYSDLFIKDSGLAAQNQNLFIKDSAQIAKIYSDLSLN